MSACIRIAIHHHGAGLASVEQPRASVINAREHPAKEASVLFRPENVFDAPRGPNLFHGEPGGSSLTAVFICGSLNVAFELSRYPNPTVVGEE